MLIKLITRVKSVPSIEIKADSAHFLTSVAWTLACHGTWRQSKSLAIEPEQAKVDYRSGRWARSTTKSNKIKPFSVSLKSKYLLTKYGSSYRL